MAAEDRKAIAIGLPSTGKTTFLAAFWGVVSSGEVAESLQLERLTGDKQHLNEIRDRWADCNPIERTLVPHECIVSMRLRDVPTGEVCEVFFTDMAGESFERQWTERIWTKDYDALVAQTTGLLLFVHPLKVKEASLIRDAVPLLNRLREAGAETNPLSSEDGEDESQGEEAHGEEAATTSAAKVPPPRPEYAATQVQMVELLQFIQRKRRPAIHVRVGIIISAWDLVQKTETTTPDEWLAKRLPLLAQFLRANGDEMPFRIYGVSAQGGELKQAAELRKTARPSDRIVVIDGKGVSHDVTLPVRWVMEFAESKATGA